MKPGWLEIIRPLNCLLAFLAAVLGFGLSAHLDGRALMAGTAVFLITGYGNAINDYFDAEIDNRGKPWRPIPSGKIKPGGALVLALILCAAGLFLSFALGTGLGFFATAVCAFLLAYPALMKRAKFLGNIIVSLLVAAVLPFGGLAAGNASITIIVGLAAFFANLAREIVKDIEEADPEEEGTLSQLIGTGPAVLAAAALLGLSVAVTYPLLWFGPPVFAASLLSSYLFLALAAVGIRRPTKAAAKRSGFWIKIGMFLAVVAFVFQRIA